MTAEKVATLDLASIVVTCTYFPAIVPDSSEEDGWRMVGFNPPEIAVSIRTDKPFGEPLVRYLHHREQTLPPGFVVAMEKQPLAVGPVQAAEVAEDIFARIRKPLEDCCQRYGIDVPAGFKKALEVALVIELMASGAVKLNG